MARSMRSFSTSQAAAAAIAAVPSLMMRKSVVRSMSLSSAGAAAAGTPKPTRAARMILCIRHLRLRGSSRELTPPPPPFHQPLPPSLPRRRPETVSRRLGFGAQPVAHGFVFGQPFGPRCRKVVVCIALNRVFCITQPLSVDSEWGRQQGGGEARRASSGLRRSGRPGIRTRSLQR